MKFSSIAFSLALFAAAPLSSAQDYPSRPLTLIVPYGPGGLTDVVVRAMAKVAEKDLGQPLVVLNKGGANGTLGALQMQTSKPDGHSLSIVPGGVFRIPYIQKVEFDPVDGLTYVSGLADYSYIIAVRGDSPWKTTQDMIDAAKAQPGKYMYGSPGMYSTPQMTMDDLADLNAAKFLHVPYKGGTDIVTALLGRQVDIVVGGGSSLLASYVKDGKIRILATMSRQRGKDYPEAPTLRESGYAVEAYSPMGIVGPKGMDAAIVDRLDRAFRTAVQDAEFIKLMESVGMPITYMNPDEYKAYAKKTFADEGVRMKRVLAQP